MHVASEATVKWNQRERERERERERSACCKFACLPAGWSLWRLQGGLQDQDVKTVDVVKPLWGLRVRCFVVGRLIVGGNALGFGGAELSSVGNCSPTCVFGTSLLGSAFLDLAIIVSWLSTSGILSVDSPGPDILWSSSSCCWRCSALLLWCGALGWGQLKFPPSLWGLAYMPGKFSFLQCGASFAIIVSWQSSFGRAWSDSALSRGIFVSCGRWVGDFAGVDIRRHLSSSEHFSYRSSSCLFSLHGGCRSISRCSLVGLLFS